jgi:hypothetical protein
MENCLQSLLTVANEMCAQLGQADPSGKLSRMIRNTITHLKKNWYVCRVIKFFVLYLLEQSFPKLVTH